MNVGSCLDRQTLEQLLRQSLPADELRLCEIHLENCPTCQREIEHLAGDGRWWSEASEMLSTESLIGSASSQQEFNQADEGDHRRARTATLAQVRQILQPPSHPEMLGRLDNYEIESFLGQGGFGVVFKAHDCELNRPVAIKVLAPQLASSGVARRRFAREAQAAAAVVHPNVVPIHAVQADADFPYLVMSFVPGCSLQSFVVQNGPLDVKSIIRIAAQVAAGLAAAHRQGLVHRDIKPANILLENKLSRALITDFGLARAADDAAATQTGWLAGTPHYMSPEQTRGSDLDGRSDLFSLGSVIYFMATGREPFRSEQPLGILQQIASHHPLSAHRINNDIPKQLSRLIDRLLEKLPEDRIQTAGQLSDILELYLAHLQQPQKMSLPRLPVSPRSWRRIVFVAGCSIAVVLAAFILQDFVGNWFTRKESSKEIAQPPTAQQSVAAFQALQRELRQGDSEMARIDYELCQMDSELDSMETNLGISVRPNAPTVNTIESMPVNRALQFLGPGAPSARDKTGR